MPTAFLPLLTNGEHNPEPNFCSHTRDPSQEELILLLHDCTTIANIPKLAQFL